MDPHPAKPSASEVEQSIGGRLLGALSGYGSLRSLDFRLQGFDALVQFLHRIEIKVFSPEGDDASAATEARLQILERHHRLLGSKSLVL
jgi:hypothetical protein